MLYDRFAVTLSVKSKDFASKNIAKMFHGKRTKKI